MIIRGMHGSLAPVIGTSDLLLRLVVGQFRFTGF
jgi:hypothetical protein